ncbi:MAG: excinuclease ABC subunit UvrA [bacterium]
MANQNNIFIKGAREHNLKNIDVEIPRNRMTVVTGVSGSGKSSLVFDTLYAEGQRRYVESLSSYARQFMDKMNKPEVDYIKGISPAIAIEQKVNTRNPRSTVSTSTEIYDYLKLLFTKVGKTISPVSGEIVKRHTVTDVVDYILSLEKDTTVLILSQFNTERKIEEELKVLLQKGFTRILTKEGMAKIEEVLQRDAKEIKKIKPKDTYLIIDRILADSEDEELPSRAADSVQTAFFEGDMECLLQTTSPDGKEKTTQFSSRFEADGITFEQPSTNFFSFNNPYGACKTCEGFGMVIGIDEDLVVPDKSLSVYEGAVAPWRSEAMQEWKKEFAKTSIHYDFPIHRSYYELTEAEKDLLWQGNKDVKGVNDFFKMIEEKIYKIQYRVMLSKYRGKTTCHECRGTRLRKDATYVKLINEANKDEKMSISDIVLMSVNRAHEYFTNLKFNKTDKEIAERILREVQNRLTFLKEVGLGYLTLNRLSNTLSGGESQRINLATSLGSSLVGSMYILDEPSIGLHSRDTENLIRVLKSLRDLGNTVVIVEHDEDVMKAADELIDIGPFAGRNGGDLIFKGEYDAMLEDEKSLTGKYLSGREEIPVPTHRRKWSDFVEIKGARENNLKNVDVKILLHTITAVTGVSGSGKTSLIKTVLYPAMQKIIGSYSGGKTGAHDKLEGDYKKVTQVEMVDQNPIGKSSRSNPVTYIKAYDAIRDLFASQPLAKSRGYKGSFFSFNVDGGRCETCQGEGETTIEMQFMADLHLPCETCKGKRFKEDILEVKYKDKNIADVLEMTIDEAMDFFKDAKALHNKLSPLQEVGLGYVSLGQSSSTLSGGEAQRIKLASFLGKANKDQHILFIFDEPTTGLHFHDINKLMASFNALVEQGHSIVIIEHNMDVVKCADWVIDIGPEGGEKGGNIVFEGTPEDLVNIKESYTAKYLAEKLNSVATSA